jgi:hypothetical protein
MRPRMDCEARILISLAFTIFLFQPAQFILQGELGFVQLAFFGGSLIFILIKKWRHAKAP